MPNRISLKKFQKNNTSGHTGVSLLGDKWRASVRVCNKHIYLGSFSNKRGASRAYRSYVATIPDDFNKKYKDSELFYIGPKRCWISRYRPGSGGYPYFRRHGRSHKIANYFYKKCRGDIPKGMILDHLCRNRACINPDHLEPVTLAENTRRSSAKLTKKQVRAIRDIYAKGQIHQYKLANKFSVHQSQISKIINRRRWNI